MTRITRAAVLGIVLGLIALPALAQKPAWLDALRQGGHVIVIRHGTTYNNQADTDPLNPANVKQQRQLTVIGRAQARSMGEWIRQLGIPVAEVWTSQFQRAVDTGTLMALGPVKTTIDLSEGGLVVSPDENNRRAQALRKLVATPPPAGGNVVLISHKPNIMDAFGKDWFDIREGEASIFKPDGKGGTSFVARVQAGDWAKLAGAN